MSAPYPHVPVMAAEVLHAFSDVRGDWIVDGTLGLGGHTEKILEQDSQILDTLPWIMFAIT